MAREDVEALAEGYVAAWKHRQEASSKTTKARAKPFLPEGETLSREPLAVPPSSALLNISRWCIC